MSTSTKQRHTRNNKRRANAGGFSSSSGAPRLKIDRTFSRLGDMFPGEVDVILPYVSTFNLSSTATIIATKYLITNGAYDADPALGSTATQGFAEWSAFYFYYRVVGYSYELEVNNQNNIPVSFTVLNSNATLGLPTGIGTATDLTPYSVNPLSQFRLMGHSYNQTGAHTFRKTLTISQVVGSPAPETEDNFRANITANPTDLTYLLFGATSTSGGVNYLSNNVNVVARLKFHIRFYDRKILGS